MTSIPERKDLNLSQFFNPDSPSGEPVLNQIRDPFTGAVHAPGLVVNEDGTVVFTDRNTEPD